MILRKLLVLMLVVGLSVPTSANVVGNGNQNFNPIPSGLDFVTVHSSETLKPGILNIGIFLNEAVNSLPYFEASNQAHTTFNDTLLGLDLNVGLGLADNWDMGFSAPYVLHQTVSANSAFHGEFSKTGNTEVRLLTKYRLSGDDSGGWALVGSVNFDRTVNNPYTGSGSGQIYNIEGVWDTTIASWAFGVNLGYRKASPGTPVPGIPIEPIGNQIIGSVGASYLLPVVDTKLIVEMFGSRPAENKASNPDRSASSLELLAGIKHDLNDSTALHAGGGTEILHGVSSPDWRVYVGLNYTFGPVFKKSQADYIERGDRLISQQILFEFDSDRMTDASFAVLDNLGAELKRRGGFSRLTIEGHTDSIGRAEYNQQLSEKRAKAIRKYLVDRHGFDGSKMDVVGKGEVEPVADNGNYQGRSQNRRVEFVLRK